MECSIIIAALLQLLAQKSMIKFILWKANILFIVAFSARILQHVNGFQRHIEQIIGAAYCSPYVLKATKDEIPKKTPREQAEEIAKFLEEDRVRRISQYLDPMNAANIKEVDQREIESTFGEAYTPENARRRQQRSEMLNQGEPPHVPPTKELPYFVNMQNPDNPLGNINALEDSPPDLTKDGSADISNVAMDVLMQSGTSSGSDARDNGTSSQASIETEITNELCNVNSNSSRYTQPNANEESAYVQHINEQKELISNGDPLEIDKDPLDLLLEGSDEDDESDEDESESDYDDVDENTTPAWYLDKQCDILTQKEMANGWSILPGGRIYKHMLRESDTPKNERRYADDDTYVSFAFKICEAFTNEVILESEDLEGDTMISPLCDLTPQLATMIKSMAQGEQAEFICLAKDLRLTKPEKYGLQKLEWIRMWLYIEHMYQKGEKWWFLSPVEAKRYPEIKPPPDRKTRMQILDEKAEQIKQNMEYELANNPCSPLWEDVVQRLSEQQKKSVAEHFDQKYELQQRQKCSEYSGSRGFGEAIKNTGTLQGYDVGRRAGGVSKHYTWHETPFIIYIAVPVVPGIRAEHVEFHLETQHMVLKVAGKTVSIINRINSRYRSLTTTPRGQ
eukprot:XP_001612206.1 hypothetical protein [Babesia bovis T2Bo]